MKDGRAGRGRLLQLGTGALGLGLLGWLAVRAGLELVLANRASNSSSLALNQVLRDQHRYVLSITGSRRTEKVPFPELLFTDDDRQRVIAVIADPDTVIVTTALKEGVRSIANLLADACEVRLVKNPGAELYVVAGENTVGSEVLGEAVTAILATRRLEAALIRDGLRFVPCMVDRQCNKPHVAPETGDVTVEVEEYAQWVLQSSPTSTTLKRYFQRVPEHVSFVEDIEAIRRRKQWLVNAVHLLIALNALDAGYLRLDDYLDTRLGRDLAEALMNEAVEVSATRGDFPLNELEEYGRRTLQRFTDHPKLVPEILSRFSDASRLAAFVDDFNAKVTGECLRYAEYSGKLPFLISRTFLMATRLASQGRWATALEA